MLVEAMFLMNIYVSAEFVDTSAPVCIELHFDIFPIRVYTVANSLNANMVSMIRYL